MSLPESILYGIVQGLCEFLPISSSGHLALVHLLFGKSQTQNQLAFDVLLHLGTLIAVFIVYFKDICMLIKAFFTLIAKLFRGIFKLSEYSVNERFVIFIIIATLPILFAAFIDDKIEAIMCSPIIIGIFLCLNAIILYFSDKIGKKNKGIAEMTPKNALVIGLVQFLAVFPGISRSGSTITGGLSEKLNRENAVRFSFIMSIPTIIGACVLKLPKLFENVHDGRTLLIYLAGAATAAITGIIAIGLVRFVSKHSTFRIFAYYCIIVGIAAIVYGIVK